MSFVSHVCTEPYTSKNMNRYRTEHQLIQKAIKMLLDLYWSRSCGHTGSTLTRLESSPSTGSQKITRSLCSLRWGTEDGNTYFHFPWCTVHSERTRFSVFTLLGGRTRGVRLTMSLTGFKGYFTNNFFGFLGSYESPASLLSFEVWYIALSAVGSGCVTTQNVEVTCMRQAQLKNMLKYACKIYICYTVVNIFGSADSPVSPLSDKVW